MKKTFVVFFTLIFLSTAIIPSSADNVVYRNASVSNMQIALTFDDGPHPGRTPEILDILERHKIKATFFVVGQNVQYYPDVFKRTVDEGHEIGNHTHSHKVLKPFTDNTIEEIDSFNKAINEIYKKDVNILRPPEGKYDSNLSVFAKENDYKIVLWSIDTLDWTHRSPESITNTVINEIKGGDIILMHDYISGKSPTPEALETIIPMLLERGFEFVTVSELLK